MFLLLAGAGHQSVTVAQALGEPGFEAFTRQRSAD